MSNQLNLTQPKTTPADIVRELDAVDPDLRVLYVSHQSAVQIRDNLRQLALVQTGVHKSGCPHSSSDQITNLVAYQGTDHAQRLAAIEGIVNAMEASKDLPKAKKIVAPLLEKLAAAKEAEAAAEQAERQRLHALQDAKNAAIEEAVAKVEQEFTTTN